MERDVDHTFIKIEFLPDSENDLDRNWQDDCARLARNLSAELKYHGVSIKPLPAKVINKPGFKKKGLELMEISSTSYKILCDIGVIPFVVGYMFHSLNAMLRRRRGCSVKIVTQDGISHILRYCTKEELSNFIEEFLQKLKKEQKFNKEGLE